MAAAQGQGPTAGEYIVHHLQHLQNEKQTAVVDFSVFNFDSIFYATLLGIVGCFLLYRAASRATSGVPGRFQAAVELLVEMVDSQAKGIVHNASSRKLVAPLALTVFVWIFLMNAMDLLPVDLLPAIWHVAGPAMGAPDYMRVVPTADLSVTMGLSVSVLLICLFYNVKIKGLGGWAHELVSAPFGTSKNPVLAMVLGVVNLAMQIIEFVAKTVSHGMRLFGNMYAGELIFMLIALMGGAWSLSATGIGLAIGHIIAGSVWAIFHILIITLQAFVFMMLTLVYVGQAHDAH
ncbi:MAG: F0F1 ATP synthase subunit A [Rubrivivax sp.]|jgi:F-type H+-transporting ATPase subunit a|nr:F0F1 ATP synthase subunit A [Rubrivivax sp.]